MQRIQDYRQPDEQTPVVSVHPMPTSPASQSLPYAYMVEQPAKCGVRFRYECEGRIASAIPGVNNSISMITYPTIAIANYSGPVRVLVSCITANEPYRPHPHNLVGRQHCHDGICEMHFAESQFCQFTDLGIVCAKRRDIKQRLQTRQQLQIDPFGTGYESDHKGYDLTTIRLCFQAFLPETPHVTSTTPSTSTSSNSTPPSLTDHPLRFTIPLQPIVSHEIYDKKAMSDLSIYRLSHYSAPVSGGQTVIALCDRVNKEDIRVRFYRFGSDGRLVWERYASFGSDDVHKHFAITFKVPMFDDKNYTVNFDYHDRIRVIPVNIQLVRPSDGSTSESITFNYIDRLIESSSSCSPLPQPTSTSLLFPSTTYYNHHHHHHPHQQYVDEDENDWIRI